MSGQWKRCAPLVERFNQNDRTVFADLQSRAKSCRPNVIGARAGTDHGNKSGLTLAFAIALEELSKKKQTTEVGQADDHGDKRHLEIYWVEGCQKVHGGIP
jgi:hypothetical protein